MNEPIGHILRKHRLRKGYSQEYVALHLNVSQKSYCKIELGKTPIKLQRFIQLAILLEIEQLDIETENGTVKILLMKAKGK